jgi:hypothetical protein
MIRISVEISVTSGKYLPRILCALRQIAPNPNLLEIVVINSSKKREVSDLCRNFNAKEIKEECSLLQSRYLGVINSSGDFILILDETRVPSPDLVRSLFSSPHNMMAFPEKNLGHGIINMLDRRDKDLVYRSGTSVSGKTTLIIPRFYSLQIIKKAFLAAREKLTDDVFKKVVAKDDRIIFHEASKISGETVFLSEYPIFHINDTDILREFKKYSRYGSTSRLLKGTEYEFMSGLGDKFRKFSSFEDFPLLFLYLLRGAAYAVGYYLYRDNIQ